MPSSESSINTIPKLYYYGFILGLGLILLGWVLCAFGYDKNGKISNGSSITGIIFLIIGVIIISVCFHKYKQEFEHSYIFINFLYIFGGTLIALGGYFFMYSTTNTKFMKINTSVINSLIGIGIIALGVRFMKLEQEANTESLKHDPTTVPVTKSPEELLLKSVEGYASPGLQKLKKSIKKEGGYYYFTNHE